jgi:hypothetical protein
MPILEDECHLHIHAILGDLPALDRQLLFLNPGALDVAQCLVSARDPDLNVLEALSGTKT